MNTKKSTKRSGEKQVKAPKIPAAIIYDSFAKMINGTHTKLPHMEERFLLARVSPTEDLIIQEVDGVCHISSKERLVNAIIRHGIGTGIDEYALTSDQAMRVANHWKAVTEPVERPSHFSFANQSGHTFHRIPFSVPTIISADEAKEQCPLFMEVLGRMSNNQAFAAWLGSLFVPESDLQQYVWIYGEGQNGKGSLAEFIRYLLGDSYFATTPPARDDKFWSYFLIDKRVVCFPDCPETKFITSGFFKSLTGGDAVRAEKKGGAAFTVRLACKYFILSNERPDISGSAADTRRPIYCELDAIDGPPDPRYIEKLKDEAAAILGYCRGLYHELCPHHERIPVDSRVTADLVEGNESDMEDTFRNLFKVSEGATVPANVMRKLLQAHFPRKWERDRFRRFIERYPGVQFLRPRSTSRQRVWSGIRLISVEDRPVTNLDDYRI